MAIASIRSGVSEVNVVIGPSTNAKNVVINPTTYGGSIIFGADVNSYFALPPSSDWAPGTGDFTWEWWQYQQSSSLTGRFQYPRVFEVNMYNTIGGGVTIEGSPNTMYVWGSGNSIITSQTLSNHTGKWVHFAIARTGSTLRVFKDGTQLGSDITSNHNINDTSAWLFVGRESGSTYANQTQFPGLITNLHLVKGVCKYTGSFTTQRVPVTRISGSTVLLLLAESQDTMDDDSSGYNKSVTTGSTVLWSTASPF